MDSYEATRIVFSRIRNLEPENASKIMGLLLIQDHGEKEMIRLAFGPEASLQSVILKAKKELGLPSNSPSTPSTPSSPSPFLANNQNPVNIPRQSSAASRLLPNGGVNLPSSLTIPTNLSTSSGTSSWSPLSELPNPDELISPSSGSLNPSSLPFYGNGGAADMVDEFQLQDQLAFLNESSPQLNPKNHDFFYPQPADLSSSSAAAAACGSTDAMGFPSYWGTSFHRRSSSVSDIVGAEDPASGFGWRPCLYFARGYCKNGNNCRFIHCGLGESGSVVGGADGATMVGSPNKIEMDQCHELLRSKSAQQQRLAAASQLMGSASFPYSPKGMNSFLQQQQNDTQRAAAAAALMMGDDMNKFNRSRLERNGFSMNGEAGMVNPASRQIYLTFPADSTFREEDVSNYFSIYGPVQDVRIPYQQKRMFGFVTFVYPETVKIILAKGNPHFVCDARVLVKPYKEKGKVPDKYRKQQQQQVERGEFSPCGTPTALDSRDPFDLQLGSRMFYNTQDLLWRRKLEEQADLQQALELQNRRLMGLQLLNVKKHHHHRALSSGSPIPSPTHSPNPFSQSLVLPQFHNSQEAAQENCSNPVLAVSATASEKQAVSTTAIAKESASVEENGTSKESPNCEDANLPESLEHNLPDNPFASPTKASGEFLSAFSNAEADRDVSVSASSVNSNWVSSTLLPANNALEIASFNSFNCQMPRFSSGHGTIGMYAGTGGPTCPVGI
ncbi:hypothetical protein E1A91_A06G172700v1 [Gossypium mustelinum]|uniref:C3H1-type domain-containing protein n=1 Tax=Gossypium mustelinum TaxID=34275 RepID=A0A5D2YX01_GOSMU|nr:hypothetical protein E1A91_A06G172700v1 [Gossypium mustelinum]TYJ31077.1 hypothetical protein E1A91_A06G172700v1 [Gossypium mustelinum]